MKSVRKTELDLIYKIRKKFIIKNIWTNKYNKAHCLKLSKFKTAPYGYFKVTQ